MAHNPMGTDPSDLENHAIFNATTQRRNVVDPRTGLFELYVKLPSVIGNTGNGPVIDMSLFYAPTINNGAALGDGWSFAVTTYNEATKQLKLHSGEVLKIEKNKKLKQPAIIATWENGILLVQRKGGRTEKLKELEGTQLYVPASITTDGYNWLILDWMTTSHLIEGVTYHQIQLTGIHDPARELLRVEYTPPVDDSSPAISSATIIFYPDDPTETLTYTLSLSDYALMSVRLNSQTIANFDYLDHPVCGWLLTHIVNSDGLQENVKYEDNGLTFPDDPKLSALPCVSTHTLTPNGGGTPVITTYTYRRLDPEKYITVMNEGDPIIRTTTFTYNKNHEVTLQTLTQANCTTDTEYTTTPERERLNYSTLKTYKANNKSRKENVINRYDNNAALRSNVKNNTATYFSYYTNNLLSGNVGGIIAELVLGLENPALFAPITAFLTELLQGKIKDKKDFNFRPLFPIFNSSFIITETTSGQNSISPSTSKYHAYDKIDGLSEAQITNTLQWSTATSNSTDIAVTSQHIDYFETDDLRKGRKKRITRTTRNSSTYDVIHTEPVRSFEYTLGGASNTELTTETTETDQASNKRIYSETNSILSGRIIRQVDADGNRAEYTYNKDGKLATHTVCAQSTTYRQTTTYAYPAPGQIQITEPNGRVYLNEYDGQDQLVRTYRLTDEKRLIKEVSYDSVGRQLRTTLSDYMADGTQTIVWSELKYDDWNEVSGQIFSEGDEQFNHYDPVTLTRNEWSGTAADKHRKLTTYNTDKTINKIEWKDQDGNVYETHSMVYNQSKLITQHKTSGEYGTTTINYAYDASGRLLKDSHVEKGKGLLSPSTTYTYHYTYPESWFVKEAQKIDIEFSGTRHTLGKRTFDSWGRVTSLTRGNSTDTYTYDGTQPVPASKTDPDGTVLKYEYIKELGNRVSTVSTDNPGEKQTFSYAFGTQRTSTASEGQIFLEYNHDLQDRVSKEQLNMQNGNTKEMLYNYSIGGRLLDETDASGNNIFFRYNSKGQRQNSVINNEKLSTIHLYDKNRLKTESVDHRYNTARTTTEVAFSYDTQQREASRNFKITSVDPQTMLLDLTLENTYYPDSRLKSVQVKKDQQVVGSRTLTYTPGGRLESCQTTGICRPKNPKNKDIDSQEFTYDALGNITSCITTFGSDDCTTTYSYNSTNGFRLEKVKNNHPDYPASATLSYDQSGRVTQDASGRKYLYDWLGRLTQTGSTRYRYDPGDHLMSREQGSEQRQIIYNGLQPRGEYATGSPEGIRYLLPGSKACSVQRIKLSGVERALYELRDGNGTVIVSYDVQAQTIKYHAYTAYGEHFSDEPHSLLGFNGEYHDADTGQSPLGRGYRWYEPSVMRFQKPDSLSPFDKGGPSLYGYCSEGDPVNFHDPDGHDAVQAGLRRIWGDRLPGPVSLGTEGPLLVTALWAGVGVLTAIMTGGTSLLVSAALVGLSVVSASAAIASVIVADTDQTAALALAWISLVTGLIGGGATIAKKIGSLAKYFARSGSAITRNLYDKAATAIQTTLRRFRLFRGFSNVYADTDPLSPAWVIDFNSQSLTGISKATRLFDGGDANTIVCFITGVLGNSGYFQSEESQFINSNLANHTGLPWGSFGSLWASAVRR